MDRRHLRAPSRSETKHDVSSLLFYGPFFPTQPKYQMTLGNNIIIRLFASAAVINLVEDDSMMK